MRLVVPDAIVFITVTFTLALVTKFGNKQANTTVTSSKTPLLGGTRKKIRHHFLKLLLDCYQGVVLLAAGTIVPSLLGGVSGFIKMKIKQQAITGALLYQIHLVSHLI